MAIKNPDPRQQIVDQSKALILKANYRGATQLLAKGRKSFKNDFDLDYLYAKALGDYSDELPPAKRAQLKKESLTILKRLIRRLNGKPDETRLGLRINFYYQAYRFRDLERVGKELLPSNRVKGLYAAGLGASLEADRLAKQRNATPRTSARARA